MSAAVKDKAVINELKRIAASNGGLLMPEAVIEAARSKKSPLHDRFDWDDSEAASKWRLHQARNLINVTVEYLPGVKTKDPTRVFVSLHSDRKEGGYRATVDVLSDSAQRAQLLQDALAELETFKKRYQHLKELAEVFSAINSVKRRYSG